MLLSMLLWLSLLNPPRADHLVDSLAGPQQEYKIVLGAALFTRLRGHAIKPSARYYNFWNMFSAFAVPDQSGRGELEGILIAAMPTVNSSRPKLIKMKFPPEVVKLVKKIRANKVRDALE
jgi:hypothetical protein